MSAALLKQQRKDLQEERNLSYLFIAHDLSMVKYISELNAGGMRAFANDVYDAITTAGIKADAALKTGSNTVDEGYWLIAQTSSAATSETQSLVIVDTAGKDSLSIESKKDGVIVDMVEKPDQPISKLAQVGLYYMKDGRNFMDYIEKAIKLDLRTKGEFYLPEVFKLMIKDGKKFGAPEIEEWLDCGKPETLLCTNRSLLERATGNHIFIEGCVIIPPVSIHPSAEVKHCVIGPYVSIAENCKINESIIRNSVINPNSILHNVMLEESIIGDAVELAGQSQRMNIGDNSVIDLSGHN